MGKKKKIGIIAAIVAILVVVAGAVTAIVLTNNNEPSGNNPGGNMYDGHIKSFSFGRGYGLGGAVDFIMTKQDDGVLLKCGYYGEASDKNKNIEKTIDSKYLGELEQILSNNNIAEWNGFDESEDGVLDGSGFTLKIEYDDGSSINAHGYMRYPDNYDKVRDELDAFFKRLMEEA